VEILTLPIPYYLRQDCADKIAAVLLPKLVEFDSIWDLTHNICDRYLEPLAA
jgi:hypothetical protein